MIDEEIYSVLSGSSDVTVRAGIKIFPLKLPQGLSLPAISYQCVGKAPVHALEGYTGLDYPSFQIDCWANSYTLARELAEMVIKTMSESSLKASLVSMEDSYEDEVDIYRSSIDMRLWTKSTW